MNKKGPMSTVISLIMWILSILVSFAVAGLFLDGTTTSNPILKYITPALHGIVGWFIIILIIFGVVISAIDKFN